MVCGDGAARNDSGRPSYLGTAIGDAVSDHTLRSISDGPRRWFGTNCHNTRAATTAAHQTAGTPPPMSQVRRDGPRPLRSATCTESPRNMF
jgi:hypothetical protein